jgi:SAM-dependent methyltransferase
LDPEKEWRRLDEPRCRIELASTLYLIERYFPSSGHVGDIAGGAGRYTVELLSRGYRVTLVDSAPGLLQFARDYLARAKLAVEAIVDASACDLRPIATGTFDAALLLGPMYHLVNPTERVAALAELRRVLRPRSMAIVAYLNAWGLLRTGLTDFPARYRDPAFCDEMLSGIGFPDGLPGFAPCVFSTPDEAVRELADAGFEIVSQAGADGFAGGMWPVVDRLAASDPQAFENVISFAARSCERPQFRDAGDHLHIVVRSS